MQRYECAITLSQENAYKVPITDNNYINHVHKKMLIKYQLLITITLILAQRRKF